MGDFSKSSNLHIVSNVLYPSLEMNIYERGNFNGADKHITVPNTQCTHTHTTQTLSTFIKV